MYRKTDALSFQCVGGNAYPACRHVWKDIHVPCMCMKYFWVLRDWFPSGEGNYTVGLQCYNLCAFWILNCVNCVTYSKNKQINKKQVKKCSKGTSWKQKSTRCDQPFLPPALKNPDDYAQTTEQVPRGQEGGWERSRAWEASVWDQQTWEEWSAGLGSQQEQLG